jgi:acyl-CoA thioesterase-1
MTWRRFLYAALLLPVQLIAGCSEDGPANQVDVTVQVAPAESVDARDQKLVLAFGDSLYAGYGLEPQDSFPQELERSLKASGIAVRVHNAGVSGDTTAAGLQRLNFTLDGLARKPDLAIIGLGGNDMLRGLDPKIARTNLDAILSELRRRDIPVLLTGMLAAPNLGKDYGEQFNSIYPDLARKHGAELDPFFLAGVVTDRRLMQADGLHPTAAGIDLIVRRLTPVVAAELKA